MASEDTLGLDTTHPDHGIPHPAIEDMLNPVEALNVSRIHAISVMGLEDVNRHGIMPTHPSLHLVTGPTITAGTAVTASAALSQSPYIPVQIPGSFEPAFAQTTSFATPLVYPSTAYYPTATPSPSPCTFFTAGAPITAVCHCVYAQPCALHHQPITYSPRSFPSLTGMSFPMLTGMTCPTLNGTTVTVGLAPQTHAHVPPSSTAVPLLQVPMLPPSAVSPPLMRGSILRTKRPAAAMHGTVHSSGPSSSTASDPVTGVHVPKIRRIMSSEGGPAMPTYQSSHTASAREEEQMAGAASGSSAPYCECRYRSTTDCAPCLCHLHCRQHPTCTCTCPNAPARRENEIPLNPVHEVLLQSRRAQAERERQATNAWFRRQSLTAGSLVGVDVVAPRVAPHPFFMFPRSYHHSLMELSMVLLQPHDAEVVIGRGAPQSVETLPVGATPDQIQRYSTKRRFVKDCDLPENEQERCTVCLMDFEAEEEVRSLRCEHVFHIGCIDRWLVYNKKCPVCRLDLDKA